LGHFFPARTEIKKSSEDKKNKEGESGGRGIIENEQGGGYVKPEGKIFAADGGRERAF